MKIGVEVEGRLIGLKTMFMQAGELPARTGDPEENARKTRALDSYLSAQALHYSSIQQIYISDLDNTLDLKSPLLHKLSWKFIVTVECSALKSMAPDYIQVFLNIPVSTSLKFLRPKDQIKISQDHNVWAATVGTMVRTVPADFADDFTLESPTW